VAASAASASAPSDASDANGTLRRVIELMSAALSVQTPLSADDDFFAHGGDSLVAVTFLSAMRAAFPQTEFPNHTLVSRSTPRQVAMMIDPDIKNRALAASAAAAAQAAQRPAAPAPAPRSTPVAGASDAEVERAVPAAASCSAAECMSHHPSELIALGRLAQAIEGGAAPGGANSTAAWPVYAIHPIGGDIYPYRPLAATLGAETPLYAIRTSALDGTSKPFTAIADQAAFYLHIVIRHHRARFGAGTPLVLAGQSYGGTVAFEMARQLSALRAAASPPVQSALPVVGSLLLLDAPVSPMIPEAISDENIAKYTLHSRTQLLGSSSAAASVAPAINEDFLNTWRAHQRALHSYTLPSEAEFTRILSASPALREVHFLRPRELMSGDVDANGTPRWPPNLSVPWIAFFSACGLGVTVRICDGNHVTMLSQKFADKLGRTLMRAVRDAREL
jgi:thioesterase domain-containing protein